MHIALIHYSVINFFLLTVCAIISYKLNFLDKPSKRKMHSKATAYTGGLAISASYIYALQLFNIPDNSLNIIISISFLVTIVGFVDDKYNLNTGGKLSLQIIPIFYLIILEGMNLNHIGDYHYFKLPLNTFAIPFTLICVLFLINSFNYFDGTDGTLSLTSISVLGILYFLTPNESERLFLITVLIPICIFLFFNFSLFNLPKLFLGDSGSLLLGFVISFVLINFANKGIAHPIILAWSISIFVYEFLSVNLERIINKRNPFKAGLDHLHHKIFNKTKSILYTNILLFIMNIVFFVIGYYTFVYAGPLASLILFMLFFIIFFILRNLYLTSNTR